ncbi:aminoglycoside adenylyltransferase domain-containing protein [Clostridium sp. AWRP]|uniref:aminoglycoside adenylyltransferase domain-containing protein n=1 Tax=Clostridium sp. AWRP TaxID=2212991 RepID=UPI000FD90CAE|nr:aminoglycoside adenylyltransferase domain-containing protein [Clostridium sp. AWRP]AZV57398.1 DUF4111 domain-containing protein [Clostridium sp. AWRP]
MNEKVPNILRPMLYEYEVNLKKYFGSKIFGVYLYNSVALGGFDKDKSDIDFITILNKDFEDKDISIVTLIHNELNSKFKYAKRMEGMYLTKDKVGKPNSKIEPYLYFCDEKLNSYGYYDINYVTWWTLKYNGIPINSPNVSSLNINVQWNNIVETMNYNLNSYWKNKLCEKNIFLSDEWIEFAVLTLCRILYTLDNKSIATKIESAKYTIMNIPDEYKLIIEEAIRIRKNSCDRSLYETEFKRENELKFFANYLINYCNKKYSFVVTNLI